MYKKEFMEMAVKEAREGIANGDGGPEILSLVVRLELGFLFLFGFSC